MKLEAKLYYINQKEELTPVRGLINFIVEDEEKGVTKLIMSTGIVIDIDPRTHSLTKDAEGNYYTKLKGEMY